jgi:hypothetical protein
MISLTDSELKAQIAEMKSFDEQVPAMVGQGICRDECVIARKERMRH